MKGPTMHTLKISEDFHPQPFATPAFANSGLSMLRMLMRTCRAKARLEVFEACALLHHSPNQSAQVYADALLRALANALPRPPVIHAMNSDEYSFDERWLLSLMSAIARDDQASARFLLRTRLPLHYRRSIGWLCAQLVARLEPEDTGLFAKI
jgi:hypothetical protein